MYSSNAGVFGKGTKFNAQKLLRNQGLGSAPSPITFAFEEAKYRLAEVFLGKRRVSSRCACTLDREYLVGGSGRVPRLEGSLIKLFLRSCESFRIYF